MSYKGNTQTLPSSKLFIKLLFVVFGLCRLTLAKPRYGGGGARFSNAEDDYENNQVKLLTQLDDFCDQNEQTCQAIQMIVAADLVQLLERKQEYEYQLEDEIQNNAMYQRTRRHPEADMIRFRAYAQRARNKQREKKLMQKFNVKIGRLG